MNEQEQVKKRPDGLPAQLKANVEAMSGFNMDDVIVHYNSSKPAQMKALAYTQGTDIHVAPGQEKHLGHEAWHVVQQKQGRVAPTAQLKGVNVNTDDSLEHEADIMGARASVFSMPSSPVVQRKKTNGQQDAPMQFYLLQNEVGDIECYEKYNYIHVKIFNKICNLLDYMNDDLWKSIVNSFITTTFKGVFLKMDNIDQLMLKLFKPGGQQFPKNRIWEAYLMYVDYKNDTIDPDPHINNSGKQNDTIDPDPLINSLYSPILATIHDIHFWGIIHDASSVEYIQLTDSEMHARGIGVCIVEYKNNKGGTTKRVIKPENKSFERAVYGKGCGSLADDFVDQEDANKTSRIGTLDIQTIDEFHNGFGSSVEYFEHYDLKNSNIKDFGPEKNDKTDIKSIRDMIAFASILGLRDLHHENLVYSKLGYILQLIDAEASTFFQLNEDDPLSTSLNKDIKSGGAIAQNQLDELKKEKYKYDDWDIQRAIALLEKAKTKLKRTASRVVLIETPKLLVHRYNAYHGKFNYKEFINDISGSKAFDELKKLAGGNLKLQNETEIIENTEADFKRGLIPFWEYNFDEGAIYQKFSNYRTLKIAQSDNLKLNEVINDRINKLRDHIFENEFARLNQIKPQPSNTPTGSPHQ